MLTRPWLEEVLRLGTILVAALIVGLLLDQLLLALLVGSWIYLGRHLWHLYRLHHWFRSRRKMPLPEAHGIWGEVFFHFARLQHRNRKRKRKLAQYLKRFQQSTEAMPDATVVLDAEGAIEWFNGAAHRLLGLRYPDDLGQRFCNLIRHPDVVAYLENASEEEAVELPAPGDDQLRLSLRSVRYGKSQRLLIARDVTRLHRLEAIRRDFVANVSHELKTPLTVITGYLETLLDAAADLPPPWARSLGSMQQQAARMSRLLDDLLLLSRLETTDAEPGGTELVSVPAVCAAIEEDARLVADARLTLEFRCDPHVWLHGSPEELRSAFNNIVQNAVRYTPEGGRVTVRWYRGDDGAHFQVSDTGIGIPAQHVPRLTERFYRVDVGRSRDSGGTGLGLAIVKHVLSRHGARLRVDSEPGEGSVFTCDFPPERVVLRPGAGPPAPVDMAADAGAPAPGDGTEAQAPPATGTDGRAAG